SPTSPKQITPKAFITKRGLAGMRKSAALTVVPKCSQTTAPNPIRVAAATNVPTAPILLIHLPTPRPIMFSTTSTANSASEAPRANTLLSASPAWPGPSTYTDTPTKYNITVGTYIMLLVQ